MSETRVLIVDDDLLLVQALSDLLNQSEGLVVAGVATSGDDAIRQMGELHPHVVLMDLQMPGIGGIEAIRRIKDAYAGAKVVALTGHSDADLVRRTMAAGADGYVCKATGPRAVLRAIECVVNDLAPLDANILTALTQAGPPTTEASARRPLTPCPFLGLHDRQDLRGGYPTDEHVCYSRRGRRRRVEVSHQRRWCLSGDYRECSQYE